MTLFAMQKKLEKKRKKSILSFKYIAGRIQAKFPNALSIYIRQEI